MATTTLTFEEYVASRHAQAFYRRTIPAVYVRQPSGLVIYVRCALGCLPLEGYELANITLRARHQRKGIFSAFLTEHERRLPLLIENVVNPFLSMHLRHRPGWRVKPDTDGIVPTFINDRYPDRNT